jgi:hypothetical protein
MNKWNNVRSLTSSQLGLKPHTLEANFELEVGFNPVFNLSVLFIFPSTTELGGGGEENRELR